MITNKAYHSCWHALFVLSSRSRSQSSCYSPHFARHTAEMRYPVAWYSALVLNVIPQKCAIYSHFLPPPPRPYTAEMRYPVAGFIASVFITLPYSDGTCKDSYEEKTLPPLSFCARCGILIHLIPLYSFANQNV